VTVEGSCADDFAGVREEFDRNFSEPGEVGGSVSVTVEPDSPEKADFTSDVSTGTPIVLTGAVLTTDCKAIGRALLDVWHADADGEYDNDGYRLRGHFFTDDRGTYTLRTIVPGLYPERTRHFHFKVRPPGGRLLTTQLYFPGEPRNEEDSMFSPALLMAVRDSGSGNDASFNFVV
jgi:protocatechuate 3,4-dioxygenase beta subunit